MQRGESERMARVLGAAVISRWAELPQDVQEKLFEAAIVLGHQTERDESLREQLAKFLHDHHKRTARVERAMVTTPDRRSKR